MTKIVYIIHVLAYLLLFSACEQQQELVLGAEELSRAKQLNLLENADDAEKMEEMYTLYLKAAEKGNVEAMNAVAVLNEQKINPDAPLQKVNYVLLHVSSDGSRKLTGAPDDSDENIRLALEWYTRAAEAGHSDAQTSLGYIYDMGELVQENDTVAMKWYLSAAAQDNIYAVYNIGYMYDYGGQGIAEDNKRAIEYYERAAKLGDMDAAFSIAKIYDHGEEGFAENNKEALKWYMEAVALFNDDAAYNIGVMYENGELGKNNSDILMACAWYYASGDKDIEEYCDTELTNMQKLKAKRIMDDIYEDLGI